MVIARERDTDGPRTNSDMSFKIRRGYSHRVPCCVGHDGGYDNNDLIGLGDVRTSTSEIPTSICIFRTFVFDDPSSDYGPAPRN